VLPCSLVYSLDTTVNASLLCWGYRSIQRVIIGNSPLLLSRRPLITTKDIHVKQGADCNRNMADCGDLFDDEIPISGSPLGSGVHMSMMDLWTSTGAEPTCEYSLHSLCFVVLDFDGRQVVPLYWISGLARLARIDSRVDTSSILTSTSRHTQRRMFD